MRALFSAKSASFFGVSVPHSYCKIRVKNNFYATKTLKVEKKISRLRGAGHS